MALNYEVKKRVFGFDETKTEKYVAQMKTLGVVGFKDLCDEVSKIGMAPRGVVKLVLDGLIDTYLPVAFYLVIRYNEFWMRKTQGLFSLCKMKTGERWI